VSNFFVLFDGKEGTSHLMMLLDRFSGISIVHQTDYQGWEPFDWHLHESLSVRALIRCLDLVFDGSGNKDELNAIYKKTAQRPLDVFDSSGNVGFKMRFAWPPGRGWFTGLSARRGLAWLNQLNIEQRWYESRLMALLRKRQPVVLFTVRQDLFRWALSMYHGDGTGKDGHLQFDIASGKLKRSDLPAIEVDPVRFQEVLDGRRRVIDEKMRLMRKMQHLGIRTEVLVYEEFLRDPHAYFHKLLKAIDHPARDAEISEVLEKGSLFRKVHSEDISEWVSNHREIEAKFGNCVINFEAECKAG